MLTIMGGEAMNNEIGAREAQEYQEKSRIFAAFARITICPEMRDELLLIANDYHLLALETNRATTGRSMNREVREDRA
jgi:hypothetical protein